MGEENNKPHILKALDGITLTIQDGNMLSFNEWCEEIENLENEIDLVNKKLEYRTLQLLGPTPMCTNSNGRINYGRSGRTPEEHTIVETDLIIQQLLADRNNYEEQLSFLKRTGELMNSIDTEEVFE